MNPYFPDNGDDNEKFVLSNKRKATTYLIPILAGTIMQQWTTDKQSSVDDYKRSW